MPGSEQLRGWRQQTAVGRREGHDDETLLPRSTPQLDAEVRSKAPRQEILTIVDGRHFCKLRGAVGWREFRARVIGWLFSRASSEPLVRVRRVWPGMDPATSSTKLVPASGERDLLRLRLRSRCASLLPSSLPPHPPRHPARRARRDHCRAPRR